jgi:hypothetical protein
MGQPILENQKRFSGILELQPSKKSILARQQFTQEVHTEENSLVEILGFGAS